MPTFRCTIRNKEGQLLEHIQESPDKQSLLNDLRARQLFPITIDEADKAPLRRTWRFQKSKPQEVILWTRQLANLLSAGVHLARALDLLLEHTEHFSIYPQLKEIRDEVLSGNSLWWSFSRHPKIFPSLYVYMVRVGEQSESLDQMMGRLADHLEESKELRQNIYASLSYPLFLLAVGVVVMIFIMSFIFPKMTFLLQSMQDRELPFLTVFFMGISAFLVRYGGWLVLGGLAVVGGFVYFYNQEESRLKMDEQFYHMPVLGSIWQRRVFIQFTEITSLMLENGVLLDEALEAVGDVIGNTFVQVQIATVRARIQDGQTLYSALSQAKIFSPLMIYSLSVAEETGNLEEVLANASRIYRRDLDRQIKTTIALLEPFLIFFLALGVGLLIMSIIQPIFQMDLFLL